MSAEEFENYQVLRREDGTLWELGRGAMGVTYKAFDTDLHCDVALKVIQPQILANEDARGRFLREARSAARLRHPNIAAIFRLGRTADDTYFYAMEYCEGETLQQIIDERGPLDVVSALAVVLQISRALVLANEHQLVHRDIKPANLIITESRVDGPMAKIIDFGLAKSYAAEGNSWASMGTNGFIGTAHFASPEQLENGEVDGRSDIYSLGATLWFMLTGKSVFSGSLARVMSQHLSAPVPWAQLDALNVQPPVRSLLARMLEKDPADRPQTALALKRAVEDCLSSFVDDGGTVAAPAVAPAPAAPLGNANPVLAQRWQLIEECGGGQTGRMFRAIDLQQRGKPVAVKRLHAHTASDAKLGQRMDRSLKILNAAPHENLVRPLAFDSDGAGGRFLVMEWVEGFTLLAVLRARGAMTLREALGFLKPMAAGFDHARQHGLDHLELSKHQVLIHFPDGFENEQQREQTLHLPLAQWPPFRVVLNALPLDGPAPGANDPLLTMQTLLPSAALGTSAVFEPALDISGLAHLIYELLGGTPVGTQSGSSRAGARYVPLSRLTEAGNDVLRRVMVQAAGDSVFPTAKEFDAALEKTADFESARPSTPRLRPAPAVGEVTARVENGTSSGRWLAGLGVAALLALIGGVVYLGWDRLAPRTVANKDAATPGPSATAVPVPLPAAPSAPPARNPPPVAVAPHAPAPALAGSMEHVEHSPRGDLRIEYRRTDAETSIWLIPEADESRRRMLYKFTRNVQVLFSPDEKWLLINDHPTSSGGGAQLYRRTRDDDIIYEVPVDMECFTNRIEDLAWRFYVAELALPSDADRNHVSIDGVDWQPDSSAFTLRFVSFGSGGMDTVPAPWFCRYDLTTQRFSAITDTNQARNAIAVRAREKAQSQTQAQVQPPVNVPPPQVPHQSVGWQNAISGFVVAFVRCNQTRDADATLTYYAPTVDYFGEGHVNQAYIHNDIVKYNQRWPVRRDNIVGAVNLRETTPGQNYSAAFHLAFYVESAERKEWIRGEFALEMNIVMVNGTLRIVYVREKVVRRDKGKLAGLPPALNRAAAVSERLTLLPNKG